MPLPLSLMGLACSTAWALYGTYVQDAMVVVSHHHHHLYLTFPARNIMHWTFAPPVGDTNENCGRSRRIVLQLSLCTADLESFPRHGQQKQPCSPHSQRKYGGR